MANPTDLVKNYINARLSNVPKTPYTQEQSESYSAENEKETEGQTEAQTKLAIEINKDLENAERKRRYDAEKELYESNQREAEKQIEYNSQRELDDLDESAPYSDEYDRLEDDEFSGNYFARPDENEPKESLGNRIRAKYHSFKTSASDTAENLSSSFGESFGAAAGAASAKYSRFKRGDPIFSVQAPVRRGKSPSRYISRPGRSISRPYNGGRFGDDSFTLGTTSANNLYYPVNEGRQSASAQPAMDMYLPSGSNPYDGQFSGRKAFKQSEFSDERERYDPFGFGMGGRLSADGFNNMSGEFGDSLLGGVGNRQESSIFGGMSGNDTVFGDGAMFNAPRRGKAKKESSGFGLDMIIGDSGGMYNTIDPSPRKTTTKRKSASTRKSAKKVSKAKPKRKASTRKTAYSGFALP